MNCHSPSMKGRRLQTRSTDALTAVAASREVQNTKHKANQGEEFTNSKSANGTHPSRHEEKKKRNFVNKETGAQERGLGDSTLRKIHAKNPDTQTTQFRFPDPESQTPKPNPPYPRGKKEIEQEKKAPKRTILSPRTLRWRGSRAPRISTTTRITP